MSLQRFKRLLKSLVSGCIHPSMPLWGCGTCNQWGSEEMDSRSSAVRALYSLYKCGFRYLGAWMWWGGAPMFRLIGWAAAPKPDNSEQAACGNAPSSAVQALHDGLCIASIQHNPLERIRCPTGCIFLSTPPSFPSSFLSLPLRLSYCAVKIATVLILSSRFLSSIECLSFTSLCQQPNQSECDLKAPSRPARNNDVPYHPPLPPSPTSHLATKTTASTTIRSDDRDECESLSLRN